MKNVQTYIIGQAVSELGLYNGPVNEMYGNRYTYTKKANGMAASKKYGTICVDGVVVPTRSQHIASAALNSIYGFL